MFKRLVIIGAGLAALGAFALGVQAQSADVLDFAVENDVGAVLIGVDIASVSGGPWRRVKLEQGHVRAGESSAAQAPRAGNECLYDVRAWFEGGASTKQNGVDLCDLDSGASNSGTLVLKD